MCFQHFSTTKKGRCTLNICPTVKGWFTERLGLYQKVMIWHHWHQPTRHFCKQKYYWIIYNIIYNIYIYKWYWIYENLRDVDIPSDNLAHLEWMLLRRRFSRGQLGWLKLLPFRPWRPWGAVGGAVSWVYNYGSYITYNRNSTPKCHIFW